MHKIHYESGGTTLDCGKHSAEKSRITHGMAAHVGQRGTHLSRPSHYELTTSRSIRRTNGEMTFFQMAVTGLEANVLARAHDQHATLQATIRKQVGNRKVPIQQVDLQRVQIVNWGLRWDGAGADGLQGANFVESLTAIATKGAVTSLTDNTCVAFDLDT